MLPALLLLLRARALPSTSLQIRPNNGLPIFLALFPTRAHRALTCFSNSFIPIDNSRAGEPPETPAPVFAIRAFKSALFGTPGADDDESTHRTTTATTAVKTKNPSTNQLLNDHITLKPSSGNTGDAFKASKADLDLAMNAMASPTKSILVTPGTASNRRKTVSFGDGVVDNERKREDPFTKPNKTPTSSSNNFSSQWSATSSDGKFKPRSKLTQALMDSREKSKGTGLFSSQDLEPNPSSEGSRPSPTEDDNDDTINLNEPRSQSGKYWKAEFDSYRTKTTWEIKKLIQYRSAAKTYAKKKDEEASRLADKLREEEIKVSEMERHVTHLASTMVGESANADKEKLVQDLTKQTALALQYKHRVNSLRKLLERHGVVGNEVDDIAEQSESESSSEKTTEELRKTQQALDEAKAKIDDMKLQQSDFTKLQDLARSSEQKACELQKENASLKQTLARVKQEMSKYEGRRKEKEAKLKQREAKLETRIQEYRERLKNASQQHRDHEESLKESFNEERHRMQEQIDQLKIKLTAIESLPHTQVRARHSESPRKNYTGVHVFDFGQNSPQKDPEDDNTADIDEPPSPSPRAKERRSYPSRYTTTAGDLDLKRAMKAMGITDEDQLAYLGESLKPPKSRYQNENHDDEEPATIPPSSPPDYPHHHHHPPPSTRPRPKQKSNNTNTYRSLYAPTNTTMTSLAHHLANNLDDSHHGRLRARRSPSKYSLDAVTALPDSHVLDRAKRRQSLAAVVPRDSIPMDRKLQAQARLKQRKEETRKGKENMRTYTNQPLSVLEPIS